ncbi:CDC8 [Candida theae]|uniref:Thymidylate kinase n=1 Tax=Candida theae TaxID=1198502 RepID=A0AAD5BDC2_9ASCO|nr:CDC8 [Candida theae]KAI5955574.1 CDC8 [Candida theae]
MPGRGQLILIEGLDRSGKSTQASILASKFSQSKLIKFPDRSTSIGKLINEYLTNKEFQLSDQAAHLLFSANRWELNQEIIDLLRQGYFVILDRYIYSGIAYTLAKHKGTDTSTTSTTSTSNGSLANLSNVEWLLAPDKGLPKPDLTMFLTLDMDEISSRKGWGDERYEMVEFQSKVKQCFLDILDEHNDPSVKIVDVGNKSIEQVSDLLWHVIETNNVHVLTDGPINHV